MLQGWSIKKYERILKTRYFVIFTNEHKIKAAILRQVLPTTILDQHFGTGGQITATSVYLLIQRATCHCHGYHHALQRAAVLGVAKRVEQVAVQLHNLRLLTINYQVRPTNTARQWG